MVSKTCIWKVSRFSFGTGISICGVGSGGVDGSLAINVFGGIYSFIGR